jgi:hypothetical protein
MAPISGWIDIQRDSHTRPDHHLAKLVLDDANPEYLVLVSFPRTKQNSLLTEIEVSMRH